MSAPLLDADGFPRSDIDIWAVRKARVRIIELRNDLKDVIDEIGQALEGVYAKPISSSLNQGQNQNQQTMVVDRREEGVEENLVPFAKVDGIAPGSPAAEAGMQQEDLIIKFGHLVRASFDPPSSLTPVAGVVSQNEDVCATFICWTQLTLFRT
jgi:26S proteasome non-ATPase regulatory subunit 9